MARLPKHPDFAQLEREAEDLLRLHQSGDPAALARFRSSLPAAADKDDAAIIALGLTLPDAQSCLAHEHGFQPWTNLKNYVDKRNERIFDSRVRGGDWDAAELTRFLLEHGASWTEEHGHGGDYSDEVTAIVEAERARLT